MLTVDERNFNRERFWGPHTIKPLNFNYDFEPNFSGQNIWTLTDGLFLSDSRRLSGGSDDQGSLRVIYPRAEGARKKNSALYRHFPRIDENVHQKSSQPGRKSPKLKTSRSITGKISRNSRVLSSGGSASVTAPPGVPGVAGQIRIPQVPSLTRRDSKNISKESPTKKRKSKENPTGKQISNISNEEKGVSVKLSLEETERLLKSLDFRVRTRKKVTTRERSKSERVPKSQFVSTKHLQPTTKMPFQKRGTVASPPKKERSTIKRKDKSPGKKEKMVPRTSQSQLVRSSRKTSWQTSSSDSSRKMSTTSTSGLGDLLGPLPRVKWTPEGRTTRERSVRKKSTEKSSVTLMKANKMKAVLKKAADRESPDSQDLSEVEGSSREAVAVRKVRTTPMKIIPKVTINNQLLKSTTNKNEKLQEKKALPKTVVAKKKVTTSASSTTSTLWTPENIALLDQITSDQQLKAVLMSAGDTYMKSRRYMNFKVNPKPVKIPVRMAVAQKKKETQSEGPKTAGNPSKTAETAKTQGRASGGTDNAGGSGGKEGMSVVVTDHPSEATQTGDGPDDKAKKTVKKPTARPKNEFGVKVAKATVVVKGKTTKTAAKTGTGAQLASGKKDINSSPKRRPKFVTTTSKTKERLAQLTSEASGPLRVQSERMAQIRRSNLDTLKKILDKSLSASNKPARPEETKVVQDV
ncbi:hypothetical protein GE061_007204 [Apolygus lucorum]|uniref:Uncharacterized protein n=1 Tax=Apolygus lucorum TaxID=248454 RepID=A0A6A4IJU5_APOLU|nr:hypothetical protein GE061_007204 [Apolygus lucorum]